ncbi:UNVERIFIED_CONTAM: hypothetical protein GTU68_039345 [Idotea baltica]|nr:hypothetical protein [Idotea baltica]
MEVADVILYDALVNPEILSYGSQDALLICVGKRAGRPSFTQDEIHALILLYSNRFERIVRLKGGDPFVFGRGHEEIVFARKHRIDTCTVPGVSSALGVPASIGIPLTNRGTSQGFWVMTATRDNHTLNTDIEIASRSSATLVILMGIKKIKQIVATCRTHMSAETPIAIIKSGTLTSSQHHITTLGEFENLESLGGHKGPGMIVIGEVVALAEQDCLVDAISESLAG